MHIAERFELMSEKAEYTPHKTFKGVFLKHLVKGDQTGGRLSCHLVKVEPFCTLELHTHPQQLEIHEVIWGNGECCIAEKQVHYEPGRLEVIPENVPHRVTAGEEGLFILAKFAPALL